MWGLALIRFACIEFDFEREKNICGGGGGAQKQDGLKSIRIYMMGHDTLLGVRVWADAIYRIM